MKTTTRLFALFAGLLTAPTLAVADPYLVINSTPTLTLALDLNSIAKSGLTRRAWTYLSYDKTNTQMRHAASLDEYDCAERRSRRLSRSYFDANRSLIMKSNDVTGWDYPLPNSLGHTILEVVCERGPIDAERILEFRSPMNFFEIAAQTMPEPKPD